MRADPDGGELMQTVTPFRTIAELAERACTEFPGQAAVFGDAQGRETCYGARELEQATRRRAAALQALGVRKGERVGLLAIDPEPFVLDFLASVRIGAVAVPLAPPTGLRRLDAYVEKLARILRSSQAALLIAPERQQGLLWAVRSEAPRLRALVSSESLASGGQGGLAPEAVAPDDLCVIQYTSGSTGDPRGVMLTHRQIVTNCDQNATQLGMHPDNGDKTVSWLPLFHDMGLFGMLLSPMLRGMPSVTLSPLRFLTRPSSWLEALHRHRGSCTFAPLFAYALTLRRSPVEKLRELDLSCVRVFGCGGEPINAGILRRFAETLEAHCRLPRDSVFPAYGMAEATLSLSMKATGTPIRTLCCDRERFESEGEVEPACEAPGSSSARPTLEHVSCGVPLPGTELAAFGPQGDRLPEGREGELWARSPAVALGYFDNPEATAATFVDGWLRTGDLGYVLDGEIYVTGRSKDLIILHGRNLHPQTVEAVAAEVEGVRKGCVAAFSCPGEESERLVLALEVQGSGHAPVIASVRRALDEALGLVASDIVCLPPNSLPKTSSGKLQRRATRAMYIGGTLGQPRSAGFERLARLSLFARACWNQACARLASLRPASVK